MDGTLRVEGPVSGKGEHGIAGASIITKVMVPCSWYGHSIRYLKYVLQSVAGDDLRLCVAGGNGDQARVVKDPSPRRKPLISALAE